MRRLLDRFSSPQAKLLKARQSVNRLRDETAALDRLAKAVEDKFVAFGQDFRSQVLTNDSLIKNCGNISQLNNGSHAEESPLRRAISLVQDTLQFAECCAKQSASILQLLDTYQLKVNTVKAGEGLLSQTLIPLQVIERLFRIEAASLSEDKQTVFSSLTEEISTLHERMRETLSRQFSALSDTKNKTESAKASLANHSAQLQANLVETRQRLAKTLESLDRQLQQNALRDERLNEAAQRLAADTTNIMVGLQYQDVLRQKSDHVIEAIHELDTFLSAPSRRHSTRDGLYHVHLISKIQADQCIAILEEFEAAAQTISEGAEQIQTQLSHISGTLLSTDNIADLIAESNSIFDTISHALTETTAIIQSASGGIADAHRSVTSFGDAITDVTSTLQHIAYDIRLIAVNAQIQATQIGEGTGLEILSEKTRELSEESNTFTHRIEKELTELIALLQELVTLCSETHQDAESQLSSITNQSSNAKKELASLREESRSNLESTVSLIRKSESNAKSIQAKTNLSGVSTEPILDLVDSLSTASEFAKRSLGRKFAKLQPSHALLEKLNKSYTMDSERNIHASAERPSTRVESRSAEVMDEVELF